MVYLVEADSKRFLKVGWSESIDSRLATLRCSVPLKLNLLETIEGGVELEKFLHNRYRALQVTGEWFLFSNVIVDEFKNGAALYAESERSVKEALIEKHRKLSLGLRNHIAWKFLYFILSNKLNKFTGNSKNVHWFNSYLRRENLKEISRSTFDRALFDLIEHGAIKKITHSSYIINE